jgi:hypothetical protein
MCGQAFSAPASPAPRNVDGWVIQHTDQAMVCVASGSSSGRTQVSIAAEGPLFLLMFEAGDFPQDKDSYEATLSFDGKPPLHVAVLGEGGLISVNVGRGDPAKTVAASSRVAVTVNGITHEFSLRNASAALDAVARCAGQQILAEQNNAAPRPIPGAGQWTIAETLPGYAGRACQARMAGDQIDTILILNDANELVLIGGHSDWATWGGDVPLQLAIDGTTPVTIKASTLNNLILALITEPALVQRLRAARTLDWTIPTGHVRAEITGLGLALDAVRKCKAG